MDPWFIISAVLLLLFFTGISCCYFWIKWASAPYLFDEAKDIPFHETALILGTAKLTAKGGDNLYFHYRMEAALHLFNNKKAIRYIVSGATKGAHPEKEANDMKTSLIALGIPQESIIVDHTGFRTWDSLWRCRETYKIYSAIIVSQKFHNERAVFIGRQSGMKLVSLNAVGVGGKTAVWMFFRECLARVKCIMDCFILNPLPAYLKNKADPVDN